MDLSKDKIPYKIPQNFSFDFSLHFIIPKLRKKEEKKKRKYNKTSISYLLPFILRPREKMSCPPSVLRPPRDAQIVKPIPAGMIEFRHRRHDDLDRGYRPFRFLIRSRTSLI